MKHKSQIVCFGSYSLDGWEVEVLRITNKRIHIWTWFTGKNRASEPGRGTLRQMRRDCLGGTYLSALCYDAQFAGVRRIMYSRVVTERLAKKYRITLPQACTLLAIAFPVFGTFSLTVGWLTSPADELNGRVPIRLAASARGLWQVRNALTRKQFEDTNLTKENAQFQKLLQKRFVPKFSKSYELFGDIQKAGLSRLAELHGDPRKLNQRPSRK